MNTTVETEETGLYAKQGAGSITQEIKYIDTPQSVTVNGVQQHIGKGYQIILRHRIERDNAVHKQISFFMPAPFEENDEFFELRNSYLKTLCKAMVEPIQALVNSIGAEMDYPETNVIHSERGLTIMENINKQGNAFFYLYILKSGNSELKKYRGSDSNKTIEEVRAKAVKALLSDFVKLDQQFNGSKNEN